MEKRILIAPDTWFFTNVYTKVIKQIEYPKNEAIVNLINRERSEKLKQQVNETYKFKFDYPETNADVVGVEVFFVGEQ